MIEISKKVTSQSLNFTSKPKEYLLQTTKLWEKLMVLNRRKKKATKPKEEVNLKRVKFVKMTILFPFTSLLLRILPNSCVHL